jgi:hypothetical protein
MRLILVVVGGFLFGNYVFLREGWINPPLRWGFIPIFGIVDDVLPDGI